MKSLDVKYAYERVDCSLAVSFSVSRFSKQPQRCSNGGSSSKCHFDIATLALIKPTSLSNAPSCTNTRSLMCLSCEIVTHSSLLAHSPFGLLDSRQWPACHIWLGKYAPRAREEAEVLLVN